MPDQIDRKFRQIRRLFPHTRNITYFNSASDGPFSTEVKKALDGYIDLRIKTDRGAGVAVDHLRRDYARLIGAAKKQVGLGQNTSFGLNIAAFGLPLKMGDEILVSDVEFPAVVYTWRAAAETRGLKLKFVKSRDKRFDIAELKRSIGRKTRVLSLSWIQFFNGYKNDLKELSSICKKHGMYFVVDGIQGAGVEPVNVRKLGIDVFTAGGHKWLLAPKGCGFFYLSDEVRDTIKTPFMTWLGVDWHNRYTDLLHYDRPYFDSARRFEMGFDGALNLTAMTPSLNMLHSLGVSNIQRHNYALIDRLADYISSNPYYRVTSSMEKKHRSSIFTFTCDNVEKLHRRLTREKIVLVAREGSIRVSVHIYNDRSDIDHLTSVLEDYSSGKTR